MVALCDCVHAKGQYQLGPGKRSLKEVLFSKKRYLKTIPGPLQLILPRIEPATLHFTSRGNYQILFQKEPLQAVGMLLWLGTRML